MELDHQTAVGTLTGAVQVIERNPVLTEALAAVAPEYVALKRQAERLREDMAAIPDPITTRDVDYAIRNALAEGGLPADAVDQYGAVYGAHERHNRARTHLTALHATLLTEQRQVLIASASAVAAELDRRLQVILKALPATDVAGAEDAEAAIESGKTKVWAKRQDLLTEYRAVVAAAGLLYRQVMSEDEFQGIKNALELPTIIGDVIAVWPNYVKFRIAIRRSRSGTDISDNRAPWPSPDSDAFPMWLATHPQACPRIGSPDEVSALMESHRMIVNKRLIELGKAKDDPMNAQVFVDGNPMGQPTSILRGA